MLKCDNKCIVLNIPEIAGQILVKKHLLSNFVVVEHSSILSLIENL